MPRRPLTREEVSGAPGAAVGPTEQTVEGPNQLKALTTGGQEGEDMDSPATDCKGEARKPGRVRVVADEDPNFVLIP
uniref:Uncharacterized protein n=1 Tax=Sphaerodactylus townsendi TaxID=933632 RepID=A0ACB8FFX2_9SAUR